MFVLDYICPALKHARNIGIATAEDIPIGKILLPPIPTPVDTKRSGSNTAHLFLKLNKQGYYIPMVDTYDDLVGIIAKAWANNGVYTGRVNVIEPQLILDRVSWDNGICTYDCGNGVAEIYDGLDDAMLDFLFGHADDPPPAFTFGSETSAVEMLFTERDFGLDRVAQGVTVSPVEYKNVTFLYDYLTGPTDKMNSGQLPLLVGHTGIAKSALVKDIVKNRMSPSHGYGARLIDIRASFIDKSDIEGFTKIETSADWETFTSQSGEAQPLVTGGKVSSQAPMQELFFGSDQFIKIVRERLVEMGKLASLTPQQELLKKELSEFAKTPVFFFDEVNRAPRSVRAALVQLLNKQQILNLTFKEARFVSAANFPIGVDAETKEAWEQTYTTQKIQDPAFWTRFVTIAMTPTDTEVFDNWMSWAEKTGKDGGNFIDEILKYIGTDPTKSYDWSELDTKLRAPDVIPTEMGQYPMVTYRGWENTNKYLKERKDKGDMSFSSRILTEIMGKSKTVTNFISYLTSNGWTEIKADSKAHPFDEALAVAATSGVPVMMQGLTSLGKTARAEEFAESIGAEFIDIDLSMKERDQVRGTPTPTTVSEMIIPAALRSDPIATEFTKAWQSYTDIPLNCTMFVPDKLLVAKLKTLKETGRKLVVFFDEVNRATPTVQSAVFEAISDNRFMGVQFDPGQLIVLLACNVGKLRRSPPPGAPAGTEGDEIEYRDAFPLDLALSNRCIVVRKEDVDDSDRLSFIRWGKKKNRLHPAIVSSLEDMTEKQYKDFCLNVADRTIEANSTSTRSLKTFSDTITYTEVAGSFFKGRYMFFATTGTAPITKEKLFQAWKDKTPLKDLVTPMWCGWAVKQGIEMYIGKKSKGNLEKDVTGQDMLDTLQGSFDKNQFKDANDDRILALWTMLQTFEMQVQSMRKSIVTKYLGSGLPAATIYEKVDLALQRTLTINDLIDVKLVPTYISEYLSDATLIADKGRYASALTQLFVDATDLFKSQYTANDIIQFIVGTMGAIPLPQTRLMYLTGVVQQANVATVTGLNELIDPKAVNVIPL